MTEDLVTIWTHLINVWHFEVTYVFSLRRVTAKIFLKKEKKNPDTVKNDKKTSLTLSSHAQISFQIVDNDCH